MNVAPLFPPGSVPASIRAAARQLEASDPAVSAFVAASAGSGKTKLLIDRLLRLMLRTGRDGEGQDPGRIQCLTFTKAAAAEMAIRLQKTLGNWVTLDDAALAGELAKLDMPAGGAELAVARGLFARVLDLPGGMRIGTIHAFCQSLLRRFPLEASLAPHFRLLEDADGKAELVAAQEEALATADPAALELLAGLVTTAAFGKLVGELRPHAARLRPLLQRPAPARLAQLRRAAGVSGDDAALLAAAVEWPGVEALRAATAIMRTKGKEKAREKGDEIFGWLNLPLELRAEHWDQWLRIMLTGGGVPRAAGAFCNPNLAKLHPEVPELCLAEAERVAAVEDRRRALRMVDATAALLTLAAPVLAQFEARKQLAGLLDYDDLIVRTSALLLDPGTAWVLFKLDGGLDHLLLDEVQDTSPGQWEIAGALTAEFFAGEGADHGRERSVFAVGDRKQSIYSFQGADPAGFDLWRDRMRDRVEAAGGQFRDTALDVSFRSTPPVLALVDAIFADTIAAAGVSAPGTLHHEADRAGQAGRVELWPLMPVPPQVTPEPWAIADRNHGLSTAPQRLAESLAQWIAGSIGHTRLESRGRCVEAGDILVLVRRRDDFPRTLMRRLKGLGVPVAGLDRLYLTDQPAVQDLLSLCDTLLLPEDDLSLACVLTSPLCDLADDDLMALAIGRTGRLWHALRTRCGERPEWQRAWDFLSALQNRVDFAAPHILLTEALGLLGARARLLRRLGPEAAEPIDELLGAALEYAHAHPPSLQGFVHWLRQSGAEVKRQAEEAGGLVRIMTVHGAKGLQAPVVILPDTTALPPDAGGLVWTPEGLPLWSPRLELRCAAFDAARAVARQARKEEYNRLLYVALTRAEDHLVVCGWETRRPVPDDSWYRAVQRGFAALDPSAEPLADCGEPWPGDVLVHQTRQLAPPATAIAAVTATLARLPAWAGAAPDWRPSPPPVEPPRSVPLAPSRPVDIGFGTVPQAASPLSPSPLHPEGAALARGAMIHRLLQHLPAVPVDERDAVIRAAIAQAGAPPGVAGEITTILAHPALAELFGPAARPEQPLTGVVGGMVVSGVVDQLAVLPEGVFVADFKTNRDAPATPEAVPLLYLRQMAAYRALLQRIFPGRPVQCSLVWTRTASVMALPGALLDQHVPDAKTAGVQAVGNWVDPTAPRAQIEATRQPGGLGEVYE